MAAAITHLLTVGSILHLSVSPAAAVADGGALVAETSDGGSWHSLSGGLVSGSGAAALSVRHLTMKARVRA